MTGFNFEKLDVYKKALDFVDTVYETTSAFPKVEQFGIINQLRRASVSIVLNIAEGTGRHNFSERKQFYRMARGSIHECVPLIEIALRQKYVDSSKHIALKERCVELAKMVNGLINSLPTTN